jgi:hypothetical protein
MGKITFNPVAIGSIRPQYVTIRIGHIENEYALYVTDAPQSFDHDDTIVCIKDGLTRYVLIPADHVQEQISCRGRGK